MAKKTFKCHKCGRAFSMAAHLARHTGTIHGSKRTSGKPAAAKRARIGAKRRVGRPKAIRATAVRFDAGAADRLIGEMQAFGNDLSTRRAALDAEIAALETALAVMSVPSAPAARPHGPRRARRAGRPRTVGRAGGRPVGRQARPGSLKAFMTQVLRRSSKPMSPKGIATAVVAAGYRSKAKNLVRAVSNTLASVKGVRKVGYGQYRM